MQADTDTDTAPPSPLSESSEPSPSESSASMAQSPTRSFLITSASGNIGEQLIPCLLANPATRAHKLVLVTRSAEKLRAKLPTGTETFPNVIIEEGDTSDATWLEDVILDHEVDSVFSCFAAIEELILTLNLWDACRNTGVKHVVYLSAAGDMTAEAVLHRNSLKNIDTAHVAHKYFLEQRLYCGGVPFTFTIIGPTLFFTNDYRSQGYLMGQWYFNEPIGRAGVSRVDPADIARAVAIAMEDGGKKWANKKINIGSKHQYTSADTARIWGEALGKPVKAAMTNKYTLQKLEEDFVPHVGPAFARDLAIMYRSFDQDGFGMTEEEYKLQVEFLGKEPNSYEDFVHQTAAMWKTQMRGSYSK